MLISAIHQHELSTDIGESIFKSQVREGGHRVCDQLVHYSDWLMVREQSGTTGVNIITT